jgi:hypothetical protein
LGFRKEDIPWWYEYSINPVTSSNQEVAAALVRVAERVAATLFLSLSLSGVWSRATARRGWWVAALRGSGQRWGDGSPVGAVACGGGGSGPVGGAAARGGGAAAW